MFHRLDWIQAECRQRGLGVVELKESRPNAQVWLEITKAQKTCLQTVRSYRQRLAVQTEG